MQIRKEYRKVKREGQLLLPKGGAQDLNVRVPIGLYEKIRNAAIAAQQSQTRYVYEVLKFGMENYPRRQRRGNVDAGASAKGIS